MLGWGSEMGVNWNAQLQVGELRVVLVVVLGRKLETNLCVYLSLGEGEAGFRHQTSRRRRVEEFL